MKNNYRLESRMRENRPCGSEGGEGVSPFRPLSRTTSVVPLRGLGLGYGLLICDSPAFQGEVFRCRTIAPHKRD